jgi:hypothetical protein
MYYPVIHTTVYKGDCETYILIPFLTVHTLLSVTSVRIGYPENR